MTIRYLKDAVKEGNDFYFHYKGENAGVESAVKDSVVKYEAWYGEEIRQYDDFDDVLNDRFYCGKSILELLAKNIIEINFS